MCSGPAACRTIADCPEMVVIPAGGFMMGSDVPERAAEGPQSMLAGTRGRENQQTAGYRNPDFGLRVERGLN